MDVHYFRVTATDKSFPAHSATTMLEVHVQDTNDHAPVFEAEGGEYTASVRESVSVGSTVTTVRATDKDVGDNAKVLIFPFCHIPSFHLTQDMLAFVLLYSNLNLFQCTLMFILFRINKKWVG